jgi:L-threonylcarbamoyladenylate synthase
VTAVAGGGVHTVAVRVPDNELARAIIAAAGGALAVTSANLSGAAPAVEAHEVNRLRLAQPLLVVDGGRAPGGVPSTIVAATTGTPEILREGAIPASAIAAAAAEIDPCAELWARYDQRMIRQKQSNSSRARP